MMTSFFMTTVDRSDHSPTKRSLIVELGLSLPALSFHEAGRGMGEG